MAHILVKRGNTDNVLLFEHYCDTHDDIKDIDTSEITLGSKCLVLQDEGNKIGIYIANSKKEWIKM